MLVAKGSLVLLHHLVILLKVAGIPMTSRNEDLRGQHRGPPICPIRLESSRPIS